MHTRHGEPHSNANDDTHAGAHAGTLASTNTDANACADITTHHCANTYTTYPTPDTWLSARCELLCAGDRLVRAVRRQLPDRAVPLRVLPREQGHLRAVRHAKHQCSPYLARAPRCQEQLRRGVRRRISRTWQRLRAHHSKPYGNADDCTNFCPHACSDCSAVSCADNVADERTDQRADGGPYAPVRR